MGSVAVPAPLATLGLVTRVPTKTLACQEWIADCQIGLRLCPQGYS